MRTTKRLYLQIYLTIVASLILLVVVTAGLLWWRFTSDASQFNRALDIAGEVAAEVVGPADAPPSVQQQSIERLAERLHTDVALFSATGERLAATGRPLPDPTHYRGSGGNRQVTRGVVRWMHGADGTAYSVRLPDGRWLVARVAERHVHPGLVWVGFLGAIALAVALAAFPVARRITRRLERLDRKSTRLNSSH